MFWVIPFESGEFEKGIDRKLKATDFLLERLDS